MSGYRWIQETRPQTPRLRAHRLPRRQLAWIIEKFQEWTDGRGPAGRGDLADRLLTNVMLYWLTGTAGSSAEIYYERAHSSEDEPTPSQRSPIPTLFATIRDQPAHRT